MRYVTVISRTTPKVRRPVEKKEHYISSSLRKTPIRLSKNRKFTFGRSSKSSLPMKSGTVSATHASIKWNKSAYKIRDERSTNGTFVNGKRISGITALKDGDKIKLGQYVLTFSARKVRMKKDDVPKKKPSRTSRARSKAKKPSRKRAAPARRTNVSRRKPASARKTRRPAAGSRNAPKKRPASRARRASKKPLYTRLFSTM